MTAFSFIPLARLQPLFEQPREDGTSAHSLEQRLRRDGLKPTNELSPEEAVALSRSIRALALKPLYPDSTPWIRKDRDSR